MTSVVIALVMALMFAAGVVWSTTMAVKQGLEAMTVLVVACFIAACVFGGTAVNLAYVLRACVPLAPQGVL